MATFDLAIPTLLKLEGDGKISHDPNDPGGTTRWGISQRSYPKLNIELLSREQAIAIFREEWWLPEYNEIAYQLIATKLVCLAVNMYSKPAAICLQRAIRATNGVILEEDGIIGSQTIKAINDCSGVSLLASFKSEGAAYYRMINNPTQLKGWLNRAYY